MHTIKVCEGVDFCPYPNLRLQMLRSHLPQTLPQTLALGPGPRDLQTLQTTGLQTQQTQQTQHDALKKHLSLRCFSPHLHQQLHQNERNIQYNATPITKHHAFHALELRPCRFRHGDPHARPDGPPTLLDPPAAWCTCTCLRPGCRPSPWSALRFTRLLTVLVEYVWFVVLIDNVLYLQ
jgi:hypothetical protein